MGTRPDVLWGRRWPASQRLVVLEFDSPEEAVKWDEAGQPLVLSIPFDIVNRPEQVHAISR